MTRERRQKNIRLSELQQSSDIFSVMKSKTNYLHTVLFRTNTLAFSFYFFS